MTPYLISTVETLAELYPSTFIAERWKIHRPLKLRIHLDLIELGILTTAETRCLGAYCHRRMYLQSLVAGAPRYDLNGEVAGVVDEDQANHAAQLLSALDEFSIARAKMRRTAVRQIRQRSSPPPPLSLAGLKAAAQTRRTRPVGGEHP